MNAIETIFAHLLSTCYSLTGNFGTAIIVFTLLLKVVLFPISLVSQKNSIILFKLQPLLDDMRARCDGDPGAMLKEQRALYKREKYSTLKAILPLLIQIPVVIGIIGVVNDAVINDGYDFLFAGFDLSAVPTFTSTLVIIPILAAASAFLMCFTQNALNPLAKSQGFFGKWGTTIFLMAFSGYFAFVCRAGVGFYWIVGNLYGCLVTLACTWVYSPKKYIDYQHRSVRPRLTKEERAAAKERRHVESRREKEDVRRFFSCEKQLVFYSEASGFYKYHRHYVEYVLDHSDIVVHYVTSDTNDQVFKIDHPRFKTYYCGHGELIILMMKMDADMVVMTTPDLGQYQYKRSFVKKDIEYIYLPHGLGGCNLTLRRGALDHYDTFFCYGKYFNDEIRAGERVYGLPERNLVNTGFGLLASMIESYDALEKSENLKPQILIAPSWQKDNIFELCLDELLSGLSMNEYRIILRPHPEFVKRFPGKMRGIFDRYGDKVGDDFEIQTDFSSSSTVYLSDLVITDWSSIGMEFSFTTKKPSLFINTPMKVMNLEWRKIGVEPMEIGVRSRIGATVDTDKLAEVNETVRVLLNKRDAYRVEIEKIMNEDLYDIWNSAKTGGEYIINRLRDKPVREQ